MAGIYLHIPFCKKACHYCDFHFSTALGGRPALLDALKQEIVLRKEYLGPQEIHTIYFGGGTPSLLEAAEITELIDRISQHFPVNADAEITLEANPDDLTAHQLNELAATPVNRLSIGIQSFFEEDLRWMNRAHGASDAIQALQLAHDAGFQNITADLIYGYPLLSDEKWKHNIDTLLDFGIPHISAYAMTVEPATALAAFIRKGKQTPMNEAQSADQFLYLCERLETAGFEHYEVSNFARPGWRSRHNSSYWSGASYLGIGPSAHSFNGTSRQWNVANNARYTRAIENGTPALETEVLTDNEKLNEYLLISLRTTEGTNLNHIETVFGLSIRQQVESSLMEFLPQQWVMAENAVYRLSRQGMLFADRISAAAMLTGDDD